MKNKTEQDAALEGLSRQVQDQINRISAEVQQDRPVSKLLRAMMTELGITIEELTVAEEEMRVQNDALAAGAASLEAERRRYQDLFEFAPDPYLVTDLSGVVLGSEPSRLCPARPRPPQLDRQAAFGAYRAGRPPGVPLRLDSCPASRRQRRNGFRRTGADAAPAQAAGGPCDRPHRLDPQRSGTPRRHALAAARQHRPKNGRSGALPADCGRRSRLRDFHDGF